VSFENGFLSPYMVTDEARMEAVLDEPYILLTNEKVVRAQELMPLLDQIMRAERRPLVVMAESVEGSALGMLVSNKVHGNFVSVAVRAPGFGHRRLAELHDLAVLTGGTVVTGDVGTSLASARLDQLGRARRVTVTRESTTVLGGAGRAADVANRVEQVRTELAQATHPRDKDKLAERLAKLAGRVAVIHVGAATPAELKEKQHRVEDALSATRAAVEEGIVAGGGTALVHAVDALDGLDLSGDYAAGVEVVRASLRAPLYWIARNAGYDGAEVIARVRAMGETEGLDALRGEYVDLIGAGVVDPLKVSRSALENAASIAALLLTTDALVAEEVQRVTGEIYAPGFGDLAEGLPRDLFAKPFRSHGRPSLSTYLAVYKIGDHVDIVCDSSVQKGQPFKYYHGRTGVVWNVTPRALGIIVNKRVRTRVLRKKICIRTEHVRKSRCQEDFKQRVAHNKEVRKTGVGKLIKRKPAEPKEGFILRTKQQPVHLGAKKFVFSEVYNF
jgi:chaperonin GroEL